MQILKKSSKGEEVKKLLQLLKITVDGNFGSKTEEAVKKFLKEHGLIQDGICGPKTWAALGIKDDNTNSKCVDSSVAYYPLNTCITKFTNRIIKYLIIHYTAGSTSVAGSAKKMKDYWEKTKNASADFGVDDATIVLFNPDPKNYYCWAVSGGNSITNSNSISIEICSSLLKGTTNKVPNHEGWYYTEEALDNGIKLARILMKKFNIPLDRVVRHYDVTGKLCPGIVGWNDGKLYTTSGNSTNKKNNSLKWLDFKNKLK